MNSKMQSKTWKLTRVSSNVDTFLRCLSLFSKGIEQGHPYFHTRNWKKEKSTGNKVAKQLPMYTCLEDVF